MRAAQESGKQVTREKGFAFAIRIVRLAQFLQREHKEYVLSKQVLRSGTSIGANVEEASAAASRKDFTAKMSIASKEARETRYWLRLLHETEYLGTPSFESIHSDCEELIRLLTSIVKTSQESMP